MSDITSTLEKLAELDVGFYCSHPDEAGAGSLYLSVPELVQYAKDPVGYLAAYYKVSKDQYLAWHRSDYMVVCSAKTGANKPCKNIVSGGNQAPLHQWVELQGSYCHVHQ